MPGDKLALISWEKESEVCCLTLIKADNLADQVREFLGPVMAGLSAGDGQAKNKNAGRNEGHYERRKEMVAPRSHL
jgi:hypothetical protein